ncbi:hypothetical protein T439DRAFT_357875 [Meredithblackwellia eburnea MCA 4105]
MPAAYRDIPDALREFRVPFLDPRAAPNPGFPPPPPPAPILPDVLIHNAIWFPGWTKPAVERQLQYDWNNTVAWDHQIPPREEIHGCFQSFLHAYVNITHRARAGDPETSPGFGFITSDHVVDEDIEFEIDISDDIDGPTFRNLVVPFLLWRPSFFSRQYRRLMWERYEYEMRVRRRETVPVPPPFMTRPPPPPSRGGRSSARDWQRVSDLLQPGSLWIERLRDSGFGFIPGQSIDFSPMGERLDWVQVGDVIQFSNVTLYGSRHTYQIQLMAASQLQVERLCRWKFIAKDGHPLGANGAIIQIEQTSEYPDITAGRKAEEQRERREVGLVMAQAALGPIAERNREMERRRRMERDLDRFSISADADASFGQFRQREPSRRRRLSNQNTDTSSSSNLGRHYTNYQTRYI